MVPFNVRLRVTAILLEFQEGSKSADEAVQHLLELLGGGDATTPDTPPET